MSTPAAEQPANPQPTMQAIVFDDFGGPEVLVAREIPVPEVRPHDLLVRNARPSSGPSSGPSGTHEAGR